MALGVARPFVHDLGMADSAATATATATETAGVGEVRLSAGLVLDCRGLTKRYGERTVVDDVGFTIAAGETYGLLGPNGAGKTTTISMLCGLLRRDGGSVQVIGHDLDAEPRNVQGAIGYVPQDLAIYPDLSPAENLRFFGRLHG